MITALNGVNSLGLSTTVQPAANAGATLHMIWLAGQFHGVISPHTPIGSRTMRLVPRRSTRSRSRSAATVLATWASPAGACALLDRVIGAPISAEIVAARSSSRSW